MKTKNKKPINYQQLFAIQSKLAKTLKLACPSIDERSGIYFFIRTDTEKNKKYAYIGKATSLLSRNIAHLQNYQQRIDISLKKRGFYSEDNKGGWKLNVLHFPKQDLDKMEQHYIKLYQDANYELYNIESGGTNGKAIIGERKAPKGYRDGLLQGEKNIQKKIANWFDKSLDYSIKGKPNKNKETAYTRFTDFLSGKEDKD